MAPLLTCIVAAYNAERTLARTLGSLLSGPGADALEIVVIDDGSTDGTGRIAELFAHVTATVRVVRQENRGLGAVRNRGVREARGEFVTFCDADDVFLAENQWALAERASREVADIAVGTGFSLIQNERIDEFWDSGLVRALHRLNEAPEVQALKHLLQPTACTKLFRRTFVLENELHFTEGKLFEDVAFTSLALIGTPRVVFDSKPLFIYDVHGAGSITSSRSLRRFEILENLPPVLAAGEGLDGMQRACLLASLMRTTLWCLDNTPAEATSAFAEATARLFSPLASRALLAALEAMSVHIVNHWDRRGADGVRVACDPERDHAERVVRLLELRESPGLTLADLQGKRVVIAPFNEPATQLRERLPPGVRFVCFADSFKQHPGVIRPSDVAEVDVVVVQSPKYWRSIAASFESTPVLLFQKLGRELIPVDEYIRAVALNPALES
jgi:hypothetical protein